MADITLRQGEGAVKEFSGTGPVARADGVPLDPSEVANFLLYVSYEGGPLEVVSAVDLVDTTSDGVWNGSFTQPVAVDAIGAGNYAYHMTSVDTDGRESIPSNVVTLEVLPPLVAPNPPVIS